jgi:hypothetical protein
MFGGEALVSRAESLGLRRLQEAAHPLREFFEIQRISPSYRKVCRYGPEHPEPAVLKPFFRKPRRPLSIADYSLTGKVP